MTVLLSSLFSTPTLIEREIYIGLLSIGTFNRQWNGIMLSHFRHSSLLVFFHISSHWVINNAGRVLFAITVKNVWRLVYRRYAASVKTFRWPMRLIDVLFRWLSDNKQFCISSSPHAWVTLCHHYKSLGYHSLPWMSNLFLMKSYGEWFYRIFLIADA